MGRWIAWLLARRPLDDGIGGAPCAPRRRAPRGLLLDVAAGSLFVTGVVAIGAVTHGSLRTDHLRVLATSLGFADPGPGGRTPAATPGTRYSEADASPRQSPAASL
jgi:hypothetical protein